MTNTNLARPMTVVYEHFSSATQTWTRYCAYNVYTFEDIEQHMKTAERCGHRLAIEPLAFTE